MAQVALAWLADRPAVTSVILGARTTGAARRTTSAPPSLHLTTEETARARRGQRPGAADYPYGGPGIDQRARRIEGGR